MQVAENLQLALRSHVWQFSDGEEERIWSAGHQQTVYFNLHRCEAMAGEALEELPMCARRSDQMATHTGPKQSSGFPSKSMLRRCGTGVGYPDSAGGKEKWSDHELVWKLETSSSVERQSYGIHQTHEFSPLSVDKALSSTELAQRRPAKSLGAWKPEA